MSDNPLTPTDGEAALYPVANDVGSSDGEMPAVPVQPSVGVAWEEGTPGFGVIRLRGLQDAGAEGAATTLGRVGANNHSPSIGSHTPTVGQDWRISIAWIESPAGDTSGVGAVMLQRLTAGAGGAPPDWGTLAIAANDNGTWVTDLSGAGARGYAPSVAELTTGGTLIAWVGADGHAHGRLLPPTDAVGTAGAPRYAAVDMALHDLGPVGGEPDGDRRLQVAELRPGAFAVMWIALGQADPVLRGSVFLGPADAGHDTHPLGWTQHAVPEVPLPVGFACPFSIALANDGEDAGLEVTCSGASGTIAFKVFDRDSADTSGGNQAAAPGTLVGSSQAGLGDSATGIHVSAEEETGSGLGAVPGASLAPSPPGDNAETPGQIVLTVAATPGIDESAPLVETMRDGFAVAWRTPGETDGARQLKLALYDTHGVPRGPEIIVTNTAAATGAPEISALDHGIVVAYVDADDGSLVVKAYAADGAQIGQRVVVDPGDDSTIAEAALGASGESEFAVVYVRLPSAAADGPGEYGSIMLQRYSVENADGAASLVGLGRDGERDGRDDAVQLATSGDDAGAAELAVGRAPAAIGIGGGGLAVAWVESDGEHDTIKGVVLDRHGAEMLRIDLPDLAGDARIAEGSKPTLLHAGEACFLLSWLQPDSGGGYVIMAAIYREAAPGVWLAPEQPVHLKAFESEPHDYSVVVSGGTDGRFIDVVWSEDGRGASRHEAVYSQRYDLEGRQLGDTTTIARSDAESHAESDADTGGPQNECGSLAAAGLPSGHVVVYTQQGSYGDHDLLAHIVAASADEVPNANDSDSHAIEAGDNSTFTTSVDEETAINPLADDLSTGLSISHINGVPITTASPVDVGFGWVQLREDGWLTVAPDAGYRGRITFDYSVSGPVQALDSRHVVVSVETGAAQAALTLLNQVSAVAEDVSTAAALKVADIAMADGDLGTDGLSLTGLDAGMFEIVDNALYLKEGIDLDFETKPTLSVEILANRADGFDAGASFTLSVASAREVAALAAASDTFTFAPDYGGTAIDHPLIDLAIARYNTLRDLVDSGALTHDGDNIVVTLNPDDPTDLQKIILKGAALAALSDSDFKFP